MSTLEEELIAGATAKIVDIELEYDFYGNDPTKPIYKTGARWLMVPFSITVPIIDFVVFDFEEKRWCRIEYDYQLPDGKIEKRTIKL